MISQTRDESVKFSDLCELCSLPGYVHVLAYLCFTNDTVFVNKEIDPVDFIAQSIAHNPHALTRTEISTLVGLLVKTELNMVIPSPDEILFMIESTHGLLAELHHTLASPQFDQLKKMDSLKFDFFLGAGVLLREPIFYGGESAYNFQYLDFAKKKYAEDNNWLMSNKGFIIDQAEKVISKIIDIYYERLKHYFEFIDHNSSVLSIFIFSVDELIETLDFDKLIINNVLQAFSFTNKISNDKFVSLSDYNATNSFPLIRLDGERFLLFQHYSLAESLYESPYYWMVLDKKYQAKASFNRGNFLENFSADRIKTIFGDSSVYLNLEIYNPKMPQKGARSEIDILVTFADRAIILQMKSKRLTIEARKGNDQCIEDDF